MLYTNTFYTLYIYIQYIVWCHRRSLRDLFSTENILKKTSLCKFNKNMQKSLILHLHTLSPQRKTHWKPCSPVSANDSQDPLNSHHVTAAKSQLLSSARAAECTHFCNHIIHGSRGDERGGRGSQQDRGEEMEMRERGRQQHDRTKDEWVRGKEGAVIRARYQEVTRESFSL